ncbi:MAG: GTP cyclohydrolase I FolE [Alphaproteobacteria bacterium]|nr:GTP cyclohydrolase I FolE [Alphaproteobacteria bacterium]
MSNKPALAMPPLANTKPTHHNGGAGATPLTPVSREMAEDAVRTLLQYIGEDTNRDGLIGTPKRVIKAFDDYFSGYRLSPEKVLSRQFEENSGYEDMVLLTNIPFHSHCEHHLAPIIGHAHVAYHAAGKIVGISKIARVVEIFAKRLQTQETMTKQIADALMNALKPKGVAVLITAEHFCMKTRGIEKGGIDTITKHYHGIFKTDLTLRQSFEQQCFAAEQPR